MATDQLVTPSTTVGDVAASGLNIPSCVSNDPTRYAYPLRSVSTAVPGAVATDDVTAAGSSSFATCSTGRTTNDDTAVVTAGELEVVAGSVVCGAASGEEEQLAKARVLRSRPLKKVR